MDWTLEHWILKLWIISFVIGCNWFGVKFASEYWKEKRYYMVMILAILFVAQNIMLVDTVISIETYVMHR